MGACHCGTRVQQTGTGGDIHDYYKIGTVLGSGSFGHQGDLNLFLTCVPLKAHHVALQDYLDIPSLSILRTETVQVRLCTAKQTHKTYAVKIMPKDASRHKRNRNNVDLAAMFHNEVSLLFNLRHRNIVRLHEFYQDQYYFYAVMERCEGGELFAHIVKNRYFSEADASLLCYEMLKAIYYIHSCNVVHRDIKAENFLFSDSVEGGRLVLIDFGMSIRITDEKDLKQLCGSPHYVAPELIRRSYRFKVDMWALGVIVFLMIYGKYPFEGRDQNSIVHAILNSHPNYTTSPQSPSALAIDFISCLLEKNPVLRLGPYEAMHHPWILKHIQELQTHQRGPSTTSTHDWSTTLPLPLRYPSHLLPYDAQHPSYPGSVSRDTQKPNMLPSTNSSTDEDTLKFSRELKQIPIRKERQLKKASSWETPPRAVTYKM